LYRFEVSSLAPARVRIADQTAIGAMSRRIFAMGEWLHIPPYEPDRQPGSRISANVRELPANGAGQGVAAGL
jgi:hypothetical protein